MQVLGENEALWKNTSYTERSHTLSSKLGSKSKLGGNDDDEVTRESHGGRTNISVLCNAVLWKHDEDTVENILDRVFYRVRVENCGDVPVRILGRRWSFHTGVGEVEVPGPDEDSKYADAIVGHQPLLLSGNAFEYVSMAPMNEGGYFEGGLLVRALEDAFAVKRATQVSEQICSLDLSEVHPEDTETDSNGLFDISIGRIDL